MEKKSKFSRGGRAHYANLAKKSVESRIQRYIEVEVVRDTARVTTIPTRKRESDAGYDVTTPVVIRIQPGKSELVPLGIRVNCPRGYFYEIRSRSSGLDVRENTIDATYTGELYVRLYNRTDEMYRAEVGDRIAQLVFLPQIHAQFKVMEKFTTDQDARGDAGWGSSGVKSFPLETSTQS